MSALDDIMSKNELESVGHAYYKQNNIDYEELAKKAKKSQKNKNINEDYFITKLFIDKGREIFDAE